MPKTILDTTVLSNFAHIQRSDLLKFVLRSNAVTTAVVLAELKVGVVLGWVPRCDWSWLPVTALTNVEQNLAADYNTKLDPGESECLAIARQRALVFVSDDFAARRLAQQEGVAVSGTIGMLQELVAVRLLTLAEADAYLAIMVGRGYRAPLRSLRDL
jgi:predicted nucleic acid-binding protein